MASLNRVTLIGNVGKDPELKLTQGGTPYYRFSLATSKKVKDQTTGDYTKEVTAWHRLIIWGKRAEVAAKYMPCGKQVYCEGELEYGKYEKAGVTHYTTDINVGDFVLLGKREDGGSSSGGLKADGSYDYGDAGPNKGEDDFDVGDLGPPLDMNDEPLSPGG